MSFIDIINRFKEGTVKTIFLIYIIIGGIYWLFQLVMILRIRKKVSLIEDLREGEMEQWPKVSVIITACNEENTIEAAVRSRLEDDYSGLELIIVEDRSTDGTPGIVDRLAFQDRRIKVVHIKQLPEGWLGKLNAMNEGVKAAKGDWFLFSDADVHIRKGTMKKVITYCNDNNLEHLAVIPEMLPVNFILDALISMVMRLICMALRVWAVQDPESSVGAGSGSFNLVKRQAYERTRGFEWLKMELGDDVAFGQMLKKSGSRSSFVNGRGYVTLVFYNSIKDVLFASERGAFTSTNFSFIAAAILSIFLTGMELAPVVALLATGMPFVQYAGIVLIFIEITVSIMVNSWLNFRLLPIILLPVIAVIVGYGFFRAGLLGTLRRGVYWRGTFYPIELLKQGRRVRI